MSAVAWAVCAAWIAAAAAIAAIRGRRGAREGRLPLAARRLRSPTPHLFAAYLLVAAWVTPRSPGETASPLLGLALALPAAYALATLSAIGSPRPSRAEAALLALLHGGALLAAAAVVLAISSPRFVPAWLR
ncbi:MAG: hypothetical protein IT372_18680 [Polyangiaceae bacterium]|nr:hypothetical protein [Polyangiaceae bacterium]